MDIEQILSSVLDVFFFPYYPASIFFLAYAIYLIKQGISLSWILFVPIVLLSIIPTTLSVIIFLISNYFSGIILLYFGPGVIINIIAIAMLVIFHRRRQLKAP